MVRSRKYDNVIYLAVKKEYLFGDDKDKNNNDEGSGNLMIWPINVIIVIDFL